MQLKMIQIEIAVQTKRHCNCNCPYLKTWGFSGPKEDPKYPDGSCVLFSATLPWDRKRLENGWLRCQECRESVECKKP